MAPQKTVVKKETNVVTGMLPISVAFLLIAIFALGLIAYSNITKIAP